MILTDKFVQNTRMKEVIEKYSGNRTNILGSGRNSRKTSVMINKMSSDEKEREQVISWLTGNSENLPKLYPITYVNIIPLTGN